MPSDKTAASAIYDKSRQAEPLYGCIEAGGTKFVCAVGRHGEPWLEQLRIPTGSPGQTIGTTLAFFRKAQTAHGLLAAIGVGSFGPLQVDRSAPGWGSIGKTPKAGWSGISLADDLHAAFGIPIGIDTDVNAAALAESTYLEDRERSTLVYLTVGTGIGGGAVIAGHPIHGLRHPEMGHVVPPRHPDDREFTGTCPYHGACTEGLASGPAILARWGCSLSDLPAEHPAHDIVAWYLGHLTTTVMALLSANRIVFGGGVMNTPGLLPRVRGHARRFNATYFADDLETERLIQAPSLGDEAGLTGALLLAQAAACSG